MTSRELIELLQNCEEEEHDTSIELICKLIYGEQVDNEKKEEDAP